MPSKKRPRFVVSDLGFAFGVHDTQVPQSYEFEAGRDKEHRSTNRLNSVRVEVCPTREDAQRVADELNRRHEAGELRNKAS